MLLRPQCAHYHTGIRVNKTRIGDLMGFSKNDISRNYGAVEATLKHEICSVVHFAHCRSNLQPRTAFDIKSLALIDVDNVGVHESKQTSLAPLSTNA